VNFILNILKGVWEDVKARWTDDVSGYTLSQFSGGKKFILLHPILAKIIDYFIAVLRIFMYWIGTGIIGIVGPWLGVFLIIYYFKQLLSHGIGGIIGILVYIVFFVFIEWKWVIPYFLSKGSLKK